MGLKSFEIMEREIGFHPAFRQLVESAIARDRICGEVDALGDFPEGTVIDVFANSHSYGNIYGHKGSNREFFAKKYPHLIIKGAEDKDLRDNCYKVIPRP